MYKFERYRQFGLADFNSRSTCMKIKCTRFLTGSSVSASPTSVRLSGERQLHPWSSGQRWISALTKREYEDNADRIAVERAFALAKQKYGLGLITSRLDETTGSSIVLSVIAMNVDRISRSLLRLFFDIVFSRCKQYEFMLINIQNPSCFRFFLYFLKPVSAESALPLTSP